MTLPLALAVPLPLAAPLLALALLVGISRCYLARAAFGLRRFRRDAIWWHAESWWGFMPRDYWIFTPIEVALFAASWLLR